MITSFLFFGFERGLIRAANKKWGYDARHGFGIGTWHEQKELFGGKAQNIASVSFRKGPSVMQRNTYSYIPNRENMEKKNPNIINYDLNNLYSFEVNDNILYENDKKYALEGSLIYRYENQGVVPYKKNGDKVATGKDVHWFSAGFRYLHYLTRHFNLALEVGSDYVDSSTHIGRHPKGWLTKFTFSPQISWDYGYSAHPVVRPFITYALWDKSMQGLVGNTPGSAPYDDKTKGFSFGIQIETSW